MRKFHFMILLFLMINALTIFMSTEAAGLTRRPIPISLPAPEISFGVPYNSDWLGGLAVVDFMIGTDGTITRVELIKSSGDAAVDAEIVNTVWNWTFEPALENGVAVPSSYRKSIRCIVDKTSETDLRP